AGVRRELVEHEPDEGRLSGTVRPDEADTIAAHDARGQIPDQRAAAEALGHCVELGHEIARALTEIDGESHAAETVAARGTLDTQLLEAAYPSFVTGAARLHPFADPDLFLLPELVEAAPRDLLRGELCALACLVGREAPGIGAQDAAVQLDDAGGEPVEKG